MTNSKKGMEFEFAAFKKLYYDPVLAEESAWMQCSTCAAEVASASYLALTANDVLHQ